MKTFRIYLLVLLTVLIPFRGAMAHGPYCASGDDRLVVQTAVHADHGHDHSTASSGQAADTKCSSCTLTCASACAALVSSAAIPVMLAASPKVPCLTTLTCQFLAESPERPPRSL